MSFSTRFRQPAAESTQSDSAKITPDDAVNVTSADGGPGGRSRVRRAGAWVTTALACLLVLFVLIAPNDVNHLTPESFARIPLEGLLGVALVLVLPPRPRRWVAGVAGVALGLLGIVKIADIGFSVALNRPFHPVFDWPFIGAGAEFLTTTLGRVAGIAVAVVAVVLAIALPALMTLSVLRLTRLVVRHKTAAARTAGVLGAAWVVCVALGAQLVPGVPVAANALGRLGQVPADLQDHKKFTAQAAGDPFHNTPGSQLLTGLRGKDVIVSFIESYGRVAVGNPEVAATLDDGNRRLQAAGYAARSAFLTSPTFGGGSWLAHGTLLSGLWVDNQQRYDTLVKGDRLTLTKAFSKAGWRTVAVMPGNTKPWSEAGFYGDQRVYDHWNMGYRGPGFNWGTPPDQYTLSAFQRFERAAPHHAPVMAEFPTVTSHSPWAPTPKFIDWKDVGDGSVYGPQATAGDQPAEVWRSPTRVRAAYMRTIAYTMNTLVSYVETYGGKNLVLVFLGDHQPASIVSGPHADHDVPVTIVARPDVLNRVAGWGWQDGLKPGPQAPVWRMDAFRDRFLTAFR
ncbi:MAG TPA: sulfatase-like hydrolase/transferase [Streptosporangiaceae bacterium]